MNAHALAGWLVMAVLLLAAAASIAVAASSDDAAAAHALQTRCAFSDPRTERNRAVEHELQNTPPHWRQWCFRVNKENFFSQRSHSDTISPDFQSAIPSP
jgi:hypothetical protein